MHCFAFKRDEIKETFEPGVFPGFKENFRMTPLRQRMTDAMLACFMPPVPGKLRQGPIYGMAKYRRIAAQYNAAECRPICCTWVKERHVSFNWHEPNSDARRVSCTETVGHDR
jgi:hypothetical protein